MKIKYKGLTWKGEWIYGHPVYLIQENYDSNIIDGIQISWDINIDVDPETVGRFIGMNKDNEELYTNDIVNYKGKSYVISEENWRYTLERNLYVFGENDSIIIDEDILWESFYENTYQKYKEYRNK